MVNSHHTRSFRVSSSLLWGVPCPSRLSLRQPREFSLLEVEGALGHVALLPAEWLSAYSHQAGCLVM